MKKPTFKLNTRPTGLARVTHRDSWKILFDKKQFGTIRQPDYAVFEIAITVVKKDILEDGNPNCSWKWVTFKQKHSSIDQAKDFVVSTFQNIQANYTLHFLREN